ncbi:TolC family protein [Marinilongibacter aquaticus]|uniref:TolC family protein n=1 Tax=Marinilongibacter aquaticus TaxID=2975157 RepID=UPI0021BD4502|nr:TolC family protein [Marinilongibacter aquaticus]UBM58174.1 TolC family protein [Marinilongibacter aquaticus]
MKYFACLVFLFQSLVGLAQTPLTLQEAGELLQKNNLLLLAEQYNISAAQAATIQAKIWDLPYLSAELNALNPSQNRLFDMGGKGQKAFAIEQIIYLGGKKKSEVEVAKGNEALAALQFEQLLRNLKYTLAQNFYEMYYDGQRVENLDLQISRLDTLLANYGKQVEKGNIALKEQVRLQAFDFELKSEKNTLEQNILGYRQNLALLTGVDGTIEPILNENEVIRKVTERFGSKEHILQEALDNNLDYRMANKLSENQALMIQWQKALAKPDLTAGLSYDQRGGAFNNQVNLTLGIPLPFWNKNKGNIQLAEAQAKQMGLNTAYEKRNIETQTESLWAAWMQQQSRLKSVDPATENNLQEVYEGVLSNFQKRNISFLEFVDFMESYNQTVLQLNEIKKSWILSSLNLDHLTNNESF